MRRTDKAPEVSKCSQQTCEGICYLNAMLTPRSLQTLNERHTGASCLLVYGLICPWWTLSPLLIRSYILLPSPSLGIYSACKAQQLEGPD